MIVDGVRVDLTDSVPVIKYKIRQRLHLEGDLFLLAGRRLLVEGKPRGELRVVRFRGKRVRFKDIFRVPKARRLVFKPLGQQAPERDLIFDVDDRDTILAIKLAIQTECPALIHDRILVCCRPLGQDGWSRLEYIDNDTQVKDLPDASHFYFRVLRARLPAI